MYLILSFLFCFSLFASNQYELFTPYPIGYAISETKVVDKIPQKHIDFAVYRPRDSYIYENEADYYKGYQDAYFAVTCKKGGWDCLRHYEILANGCIPYFENLYQCPPKNMHLFPKELILEAMRLPGVSNGKINRRIFDFKRYYEILEQLLQYTRDYLTTRKMAEYVLNMLNYKGTGKILFISLDSVPEYLRDTILIGLKESLQNRVVDFPKLEYIYQSYDKDIKNLYGKGMTYTKIVPDLEVDRTNLEERIKNREFDLVIYSELHKAWYKLPFYDLVLEHYAPEEIAYFYAEENHPACKYNLKNLFMREYDLHLRSYLPCDPHVRGQ